jgi:precorrin-2 dehydrogenase/sirohydrochlorin ferrochelatase
VIVRGIVLTYYRMIKVSDAYSLEDLCEMDEEDVKTLLEFYAPDKVPRLACLRVMKNRYDAFDGSFGFYVGC